MKYKNTIQMIIGMFCSVLAGCSTAENVVNDTDLEKNEKSSNVVLSLKCEYDINQFYNSLEDLSNTAETIIKCKVLDRKSFVPVGGSI